MRILIVNDRLGPNSGSEEYLLRLCQCLEKAGHLLGFLYERRTPGTQTKWKEYEVAGLHTPGEGATRKVVEQVRYALEKFTPDRVIAQNLDHPAVLAALLAGDTPVVRIVQLANTYCLAGTRWLRHSDRICGRRLGPVCCLNAYREGCCSRRPDRLWRIFNQRRRLLALTRRCQATVVLSQYMKCCLIENGVDATCVHVVPPCVEADRYWIPPEDRYRLLFVGQLIHQKGLHCVLQTLTALPCEICLDIIGDGPDRFAMEVQAVEKGLSARVRFLGWQPNDKVQDAYRRCAALLVPSLWPEPFGIVGIEAMSHGRPVVAFDVGGIPEWLQHEETGFLVPRGDVSLLTERIRALCATPALADQQGQAGYQRAVRDFCPRKFEAAYKQLVADAVVEL